MVKEKKVSLRFFFALGPKYNLWQQWSISLFDDGIQVFGTNTAKGEREVEAEEYLAGLSVLFCHFLSSFTTPKALIFFFVPSHFLLPVFVFLFLWC